MTKSEYLHAVNKASRIFAYIAISLDSTRKRPVRISKTKARGLVASIPEHEKLDATWADDEQKFLLVG